MSYSENYCENEVNKKNSPQIQNFQDELSNLDLKQKKIQDLKQKIQENDNEIYRLREKLNGLIEKDRYFKDKAKHDRLYAFKNGPENKKIIETEIPNVKNTIKILESDNNRFTKELNYLGGTYNGE